ncbi:MAG TPA: hypothetical protein VGU02_00690, partial [Gaiellaceae bacterium]|nr:hypothetical protein [Gaiellaceae bacterium]
LPIDVASSVATGSYDFNVVGHASGVSDVVEPIEIDVIQPSADGVGAMGLDQQSGVVNASVDELDFHFSLAGGQAMDNGGVKIDMPTGWGAPSAGSVTASAGDVTVSGQSVFVENVTMTGGDSLDITVQSESTPDTAGDVSFPVSEKSTSGGTYTAIGSDQATITLAQAPGAGTATISPASQTVGASGVSETITYTAGDGGISNGFIVIHRPDGWPNFSTDPSQPGYTSSTRGIPSVGSSDSISIALLTLPQGQSVTVTYGSKAHGGPGLTVPSDGGSDEFTVSSGGTGHPDATLAEISDSPSVAVTSADGSGYLTVSPSDVGLGATGTTLDFHYSPASGGTVGGEVDIQVPDNWTTPSTDPANPGFVEATAGSVHVSGHTIQVQSLDLPDWDALDVYYGATDQGGPGVTAPASASTDTWSATEASGNGSLTPLGSSPKTELVAPDGSGTLAVDPGYAVQGTEGNTFNLTYTAAAGGIDNGWVQVDLPDGWEAAQTSDGNSEAYVSATLNGAAVEESTISIDNNAVTVGGLTMNAGDTLVITYADATAPSEGETDTWYASEASSSFTYGDSLATSPTVSVVSADGSGSMQVDTPVVGQNKPGNTLSFTYTADTGGLVDGTIELDVPVADGWSAPSKTHTAPGYTTVLGGEDDSQSYAVNGTTGHVTVSNVTLAEGETLTITYGDTSAGSTGAHSGNTAGDATFTTLEASTPVGTLTPLFAGDDSNPSLQPVVTIVAPPTVSGVVDSNYSGAVGLQEDAVTISGSGFMVGDTPIVTDVQFNGVSVDTFQVDDAGTIETNVPDGASTGHVTVITAGGTSATSSADAFTVIVSPRSTRSRRTAVAPTARRS